MSILVKVLGVVFVGAISVVLLRKTTTEISVIISFAVVSITAVFVISSVSPYFEKLENAVMNVDVDVKYFKTAIKILGLSYLSGAVADTCRDFGEGALANAAEFTGKCMIFVLSVPMLLEVLDVALSFIKL